METYALYEFYDSGDTVNDSVGFSCHLYYTVGWLRTALRVDLDSGSSLLQGQ